MRLVLLGPPGAGKGTLAGLLQHSLKIEHISTGDILRSEIKQNSPLGQQAKKFIEKGDLVPDKLVTQIIEQKLNDKKILSRGFMLDGFPRTEVQAEDLDQILTSNNRPIQYAIYLTSTLEIIVKRLSGRSTCRNCGAVYNIHNRPPKKSGICDQCQGELYQRADDKAETIETRMNVYNKNTEPIIQFYKKQGKLIEVDGDKESEELEAVLLKRFNENRNKH